MELLYGTLRGKIALIRFLQVPISALMHFSQVVGCNNVSESSPQTRADQSNQGPRYTRYRLLFSSREWLH